MMQPWAVVVLLLPLINGDVSHLPREYIPPSAELEPTTRSAADGQEVQKDPSGFYPSTGLPLPPGYAIPTGSNVLPQPVQPPNFPLPIYPPFYGFGGGPVEQGGGHGIGPVPSAYPNGGAFPAGPTNGGAFAGGPTNAAFQLPPGGPFGPQAGNFAQPGGFPQTGGFPPQGAGFQPQGIPGNGFPTQGAPFSPQQGVFPSQGGAFGPQGIPGNGFLGGNFPPQGGPFPGSAYPPEFLTNQGLPPSVSYSAPSVSYSAPAVQQSYSAPSVSYSAPAVQQSYSAPAVSYSAPSVSYSAPSVDVGTQYASNGGYVYRK